MRRVDSRRLTGPNIDTRTPGAIACVAWDPADDVARALAAWQRELLRMHAALGLAVPDEITTRGYPGGHALCFSAPRDLLLVATEINEWAVASAIAELEQGTPLELENGASELRTHLQSDQNPALRVLIQEAQRRGVLCLAGEDELTLGAGRTSERYRVDLLPEPAAVPWATLRSIPVALVTGTNGKTTSVRLAARMAKLDGRSVGTTSTDGIQVAGVRVADGDWTGPGGARALLRRRDIDLAILETARGGLLRRGLPLERADAALITNVSADHLGEFGVYDLETLARVKGLVGTIVHPQGRVILNAADPHLVKLAARGLFSAPIVYFARDPDLAIVREHRARGGEAWLTRGETVVRAHRDGEQPLLPIADIALALGGKATYNVDNALGACALAWALGVRAPALIQALRTFGNAANDNPGRGQLYRFPAQGVRVLIDFGHNPEGIRAVLGLTRQLLAPGAGRLCVVLGLPGDRRDEDFAAVAAEVARAAPDHVILHDVQGYLRGRAPGEVPGLLHDALLACGMTASQLTPADSEATGLEQALGRVTAGDLIVVLPHVEHQAVAQMLAQTGAVLIPA